MAEKMKVVLGAILGVAVLWALTYAGFWMSGHDEQDEANYALVPAKTTVVEEWSCPDGQADGNNCLVAPVKLSVQKWVCENGDDDGPSDQPHKCRIFDPSCPIWWLPFVLRSSCSN